jgi:hypothetical protein
MSMGQSVWWPFMCCRAIHQMREAPAFCQRATPKPLRYVCPPRRAVRRAGRSGVLRAAAKENRRPLGGRCSQPLRGFPDEKHLGMMARRATVDNVEAFRT